VRRSVLISTAVQARTGSRTQSAASHAFDIRIVAFAASPRAVRGLCELFGVDAGTAQRVIANAPAVVRRGVPAAEAQRLAAALTELGAKIALDPLPGPAIGAPRPPPPPPTAAMPRRPAANDAPPALHVDSAELEFDVLSAFDAAFDTGGAPRDDLPLPAPMPEPAPEPFSALDGDDGVRRQGRREELELGAETSADAIDIDLVHAAPARARAEAPAARDRRAQPQPPAVKSGDGQAQPGPAPLTRAAVVARPESPGTRSRTLPLLQLLGGLGVCVAGYWLDSSILFGNAGILSVIAHGLALQQLALGVRGLVR
jgi:ribosomal protein L7/L12